jgi:hypothetical protein
LVYPISLFSRYIYASLGHAYEWQKRIAELFEINTYSVVNIFDATLRPQLNVTGVVEVN